MTTQVKSRSNFLNWSPATFAWSGHTD